METYRPISSFRAACLLMSLSASSRSLGSWSEAADVCVWTSQVRNESRSWQEESLSHLFGNMTEVCAMALIDHMCLKNIFQTVNWALVCLHRTRISRCDQATPLFLRCSLIFFKLSQLQTTFSISLIQLFAADSSYSRKTLLRTIMSLGTLNPSLRYIHSDRFLLLSFLIVYFCIPV